MATRNWTSPSGNISKDWYYGPNWSPAGAPQPGDVAIVSVGTISLAASDPPTLNAIALTLGGASRATLQAGGISFGAGFAITDGGSATISVNGNDSFAGSIAVPVGAGLSLDGAAPTVSLTLAASAPVTVGAGASLNINAGNTGGGANDFTIANNTAIQIVGGTLNLNSGTLAGTGSVVLSAGAAMNASGTIAAGQTIVFADTTGFLNIAPLSAVSFSGAIAGFRAGDMVVAPVVADGYGYANGVVTLAYQGTAIDTLNMALPVGTTLHLSASRYYGTLVTASKVTRDFNGGTADLYAANAWHVAGTATAGAPLAGDTLRLTSGTLTLSAADAASQGAVGAFELRVSGGTAAAPTTLQVTDDTLGQETTLRIAGDKSSALLASVGTAINQGEISIEGRLSTLAITAASDGATSTFVNGGSGAIVVGTEASLVLAAGTIDNNGGIVVSGNLTIAAGTTMTSSAGSGLIDLQGAAQVVASGTETNTFFLFQGPGAKLTIANLPGLALSSQVDGFGAGDVVDITGVIANGSAYNSSTGVLTLTNNGALAGALTMFSGDGGASFVAGADGAGGTNITYQPAVNTNPLQLPVPVVAASGQTLTLASILAASFGGTPVGASTIGLTTFGTGYLKASQFQYWVPNGTPGSPADAVQTFVVNGVSVSQLGASGEWPPIAATKTIAAGAIASAALVAGNVISRVAFISVPSTGTAPGAAPAATTYSLDVINPGVVSPTAFSGIVNPSDIVASANRFANFYGQLVDSNDCPYLADDIAAAAGATMPFTDYATDPGANQPGGFWRIAYAGSAQANPPANWTSRAQAGDVVRMGWATGSNGGPAHTTTVLAVNPDGSLLVYDDIDYVPGDATSFAGIHTAVYWPDTLANAITIYRLDPRHQYLISGAAPGQYIQGSVYNDLIQPNFPGAIVTGGAGNDEVQGTGATLAGTTITDYHAGDTIDFTDVAPASVTQMAYDATTGRLSVTSGAVTTQLQLVAGLAQNFVLGGDGAGGTIVACFAAGTRIATPDGMVEVERLHAGQQVLLARGGEAPVRWLGHRRVEIGRHPRPWDVRPVRVRAGAFGPGAPARDVLLSPDHAIYANGVLIPVRYLLNGVTVTQEAMDAITYWHVELASHDILLADGLPAESYLDTGNRAAFANGGDVIQAHPDFARAMWDAQGCAPLVMAGGEVAKTRRLLRGRAGVLGWRITRDPDLAMQVDGARLLPRDLGRGAYRFILPDGARGAGHLTSRRWVPAEMLDGSDDTRALGVAVAALRGHGTDLDVMTLACDGWRQAEQDLRWTTGAAEIPIGGCRALTVVLADAGASYWARKDAGKARTRIRTAVAALASD